MACAVFLREMQALDERLRQRIHSVVDDHVDASKMVRGLDNIVHIYSPAFKPDSIRLNNIPGLVMCQAASLDMV